MGRDEPILLLKFSLQELDGIPSCKVTFLLLHPVQHVQHWGRGRRTEGSRGLHTHNSHHCHTTVLLILCVLCSCYTHTYRRDMFQYRTSSIKTCLLRQCLFFQCWCVPYSIPIDLWDNDISLVHSHWIHCAHTYVDNQYMCIKTGTPDEMRIVLYIVQEASFRTLAMARVQNKWLPTGPTQLSPSSLQQDWPSWALASFNRTDPVEP